jgi:hypothetical protein
MTRLFLQMVVLLWFPVSAIAQSPKTEKPLPAVPQNEMSGDQRNSVQVVDCVKYSCSPDISVGIAAAYKALPSSGGTIRIPGAPYCYSQTNEVYFNVVGKPVILQGDGADSSCIRFSPSSGSGSAFVLDWGTRQRTAYGLRDIYLRGPGSNSNTVGLQLGISNGAEMALLDGIKVEGFGTGIADSNTESFLITLRKSMVSGNKKNLTITADVENFNIEHSVLSNYSAANEVGCISITAGVLEISDSSIDSCQLAVSGTAVVVMTGGQMENPNSDAYDFVRFTGVNSLRMQGVFMLQDLQTSPNPEQISIEGQGTFAWTNGSYFSAAAQTNFIRITGGNPNIYSYGNDDASNAYTQGWLGGSTTGKVALVPEPTTGDTILNGNLRVGAAKVTVGTTGAAMTSTGSGGTMASQGADINALNQIANAHLQGAVAPGGPMRFQVTDFGQCEMGSGTCGQQSLGSTYAKPPLCFASWTGVGSLKGGIKVSSTATTVTLASSDGNDTAQVNWICFGN